MYRYVYIYILNIGNGVCDIIYYIGMVKYRYTLQNNGMYIDHVMLIMVDS